MGHRPTQMTQINQGTHPKTHMDGHRQVRLKSHSLDPSGDFDHGLFVDWEKIVSFSKVTFICLWPSVWVFG